MSSTTISFYGGLTSIGGVHVLVENEGSGLVFDFGVPVDRRGLFAPAMQPDAAELLSTFLRTKMAPPLLDLYAPEYIVDVSARQLERVWETDHLPGAQSERAVFVSHIHQDHMTLLRFAAEGLPVYMHRDAKIVYECVEESGEYQGSQADIRGLEHGDAVSIGSLELTLLEHDHDTPGASGFILRTPDGTIGFTGDWRRHGRHADRIDRFIDACRDAECDVLITEGTTLNTAPWGRSSTPITELEVTERYRELLAGASGLVYVNVLARNTERMADIITATHDADRLLAMDRRTALFWDTALRAGMHALTGYDRACEASIRMIADDGPATRLPYRTVTLAEVASEPSAFAYYIILETTNRIAAIETALPTGHPRSSYFHADGNPLSDSDAVLHRWFYYYGIDYCNHSTGGHADPASIEDLVQRIRPRVVESPDTFRS
ncbi:MAG: MBL fold metallo-hydrolase [Spirochaetota bacterium]